MGALSCVKVSAFVDVPLELDLSQFVARESGDGEGGGGGVTRGEVKGGGGGEVKGGEESIIESVREPIRESAKESVRESIKESVKESIKESLDEKQDDGLYRLLSVVVHSGGYGSGHYFSYARTGTGNWLCCNDGIVTQATANDVLKAEAYICLYERVGRDGGVRV